MSATEAWLVRFGESNAAVIGRRQLLHLLPAPVQLHDVPGSRFYCRHALVWEGEPIPVMDVSAWLLGGPIREQPAVLAVAAFRERVDGESRRGALMLSSIPRRIVVRDEQACAPPADWRQISLSCIRHEDRALPVLNLAYMFSGALNIGEGVGGPSEENTTETALAAAPRP